MILEDFLPFQLVPSLLPLPTLPACPPLRSLPLPSSSLSPCLLSPTHQGPGCSGVLSPGWPLLPARTDNASALSMATCPAPSPSHGGFLRVSGLTALLAAEDKQVESVKRRTDVGGGWTEGWAQPFQSNLCGFSLWVLRKIELSLANLVFTVLLVSSPSTVQWQVLRWNG